MKIKFFGKVEGGKLELNNKQDFTNHYKKFEGKQIEVTCEEVANIRSNNQNKYYFGVVVKLFADYLGYNIEEMHEILKFKFLKELKVNAKYDLEIVKLKHSRDLSTKEFEEYLENCRQWGARLGLDIPLPNEVETDLQKSIVEILGGKID